MAIERKFAICNVCGAFVGIIEDAGNGLSCCGEAMKILTPNTTDAATEKHVPAMTKDGAKLCVQVGEVIHPMTEEHHISWIAVSQGNKMQRVELGKTDEPKAEFAVLDDGTPIVVFEYCNLHGLWKAEIN